MKTKQLLIVMVTLIAFASFTAYAEAYNSDEIGSVHATAKVDGDTTFSIDQTDIGFSDPTADSFATNRVLITYTSNYNPWKIAISTNNTQVLNYDDKGTTTKADDTGRYAKGGLAASNGLNVVACKWVCQDDATDAPSIANINSGGKDDTGYNFIKDVRDEDDPLPRVAKLG